MYVLAFGKFPILLTNTMYAIFSHLDVANL